MSDFTSLYQKYGIRCQNCQINMVLNEEESSFYENYYEFACPSCNHKIELTFGVIHPTRVFSAEEVRKITDGLTKS